MIFKDVEIRYGNKKVLSDISLSIRPGEFVFITGASGGGKTSFIKAMIGELAPSKGTIINDQGDDIYQLSRRDLALYRRKIGVVFQDFKLLETKNVSENVAFAMEVSGYSDRLITKRIPEVLMEVGMLSKKENFVTTLSGGEAQRVGIARALIHEPDIIIGDEPTGNLDPKNAEEIMTIFTRLSTAGKTVVLSTHDSQIVNSLKKRVITFEWGKCIRDVVSGTYQ